MNFDDKPWLESLLQLLVMEDGLSSDPTRGSRSDFPFSRPGRTTLCLSFGEIGQNQENLSIKTTEWLKQRKTY